MELEAANQNAAAEGCLTMTAPSAVFTIARVAEMLGEDEAWLDKLADQLDPRMAASGSTIPPTAQHSVSPCAASRTSRNSASIRSADRARPTAVQQPRPSPYDYVEGSKVILGGRYDGRTQRNWRFG